MPWLIPRAIHQRKHMLIVIFFLFIIALLMYCYEEDKEFLKSLLNEYEKDRTWKIK